MVSWLQDKISKMNDRRHNLTLWSLDVQDVSQSILDNQKLKDYDNNNRLPYKTDDFDHGFNVGSERTYIDPITNETIYYKCTDPTNGNAVWQGVRLTGNNAAIDDPGYVPPSSGGSGLDSEALDVNFILE